MAKRPGTAVPDMAAAGMDRACVDPACADRPGSDRAGSDPANGGWAATTASVGRAVVRELSGAWRRRSRSAEEAALPQCSFLADASMVLGTSLDPQRIVEMTAALAVPRLGSAAIVWLRGEGNSVPIAASSFLDPKAAGFVRAAYQIRPATVDQEIPPGSVVRTGQSYYVPKYTEKIVGKLFAREAYDRFWEFPSGPTITVPIHSRGRVLGALTVDRAGMEPFSALDIHLVEELARRGGAALDNAQLFRDVEESALTLQRSLLPAHPPALDGMEIAMEYRPGTAGTEVGGDLYDVIPLPGGRAGIAIGDVMGRGLHAAAVMGQLRAALRAYALEDWGPAELLARLDRVVDSLPGLQLATSMYAVYDPYSGRATIASAGHPPPLLLLPDEQPDYLVLEPGLPLGTGEADSFSETTITLPPGSALVLFTDGLVESRRRSLADGLEHLRSGLADQVTRPRAARDLASSNGASSNGASSNGASSNGASSNGAADNGTEADVLPADSVAGDSVAAGAVAGGTGAGGTGGSVVAASGADANGTAVGGPAATASASAVLPERRIRERRSGRDRRGGYRRSRNAGDRRRAGSFAARSWSGPDAVTWDGPGPIEETARTVLERCLLAAELPARTDDDIALLVLVTRSVRPPLIQLALPAVAASAGQARTSVRAALHDAGISSLDDAILLVSEVVTNAVLHARSDLVLRATLEPGRLRISVEDREGSALPRPGDESTDQIDAEHGWGLLLVEALAQAWGVETTPDGKRVWFEMEIPDEA
ncbi:SpoIIE family protein phosphatase [Parafrankia sp. EUN1f]|uniref:ATP-binding SpoIIE family protein phosphatase n=1 Tax=Parafrankia sp. EUN1f TaxID=102897 RepID=UPI0001C4562E|nr:SpoIIE family protein phosphatase [Parafrankia sp. EUN1f]EFC83311.1 protein serine phosphatase with GAF(s) sensor(s) [Parafrankia sp. EUN1f]